MFFSKILQILILSIMLLASTASAQVFIKKEKNSEENQTSQELENLLKDAFDAIGELKKDLNRVR